MCLGAGAVCICEASERGCIYGSQAIGRGVAFDGVYDNGTFWS